MNEHDLKSKNRNMAVNNQISIVYSCKNFFNRTLVNHCIITLVQTNLLGKKMKRVLYSIFCGTILVVGYFLFLAILYQIRPISFGTLAILLKPINLPYDIYKSIFGFYVGNPMVVKVFNIVCAILLYSIPCYLVFTVFEKMKKSNINGSELPPEPPIF